MSKFAWLVAGLVIGVLAQRLEDAKRQLDAGGTDTLLDLSQKARATLDLLQEALAGAEISDEATFADQLEQRLAERHGGAHP